MGVFGAAAAGSIPESVSSPPAEIRELPATTTPADLTNSEQPDNANSTTTPIATAPANDNKPPASADTPAAVDLPANELRATGTE